MEHGPRLMVLVLVSAQRAELWPLPDWRDAINLEQRCRLVDAHHTDRLLRRLRLERSVEPLEQRHVASRFPLHIADEPDVDVALWAVLEERADGDHDSFETIGHDDDGGPLLAGRRVEACLVPRGRHAPGRRIGRGRCLDFGNGRCGRLGQARGIGRGRCLVGLVLRNGLCRGWAGAGSEGVPGAAT